MEIYSQNTTSQHILRERKKREGTPKVKQGCGWEDGGEEKQWMG